MSSALAPALQTKLRGQLAERRARLESSIADLDRPADLMRLLAEVDSALSRLDGDRYGTCLVCDLAVADEDLEANPMATYCLCHLTPERQRALQRDLDLAWHVQAALLPPLGLSTAGWQTYYRYLPHGPVSGDYCDLVPSDAGAGLYFMLGDVSGKGVAASLLMSHLNALLRGFARSGFSPEKAVAEAHRLLAESTLDSHYATLVCGRASASGEIEIVNAAHCAPVIVRASGAVERMESTGMPLGLDVDAGNGQRYLTETAVLRDGDALVLYTDGLSEAVNARDDEYGGPRLAQVLERSAGLAARQLVVNCLTDLSSFLGGAALNDDLTILALARA